MIDEHGYGALQPVSEALQAIATHCTKINPVEEEIENAAGRILAAAVRAPAAIPSFPIALIEGWAVAAQDTLGASSYTPVYANKPPRIVLSGDPMPEETDAVLPLPSLNINSYPIEILNPATPGEGVRAAGSDFAAGEEIAAAGTKLRFDHIVLFRLAKIGHVLLRIPRVSIVTAEDRGSPDGLQAWLAALVMAEGGRSSLHFMDSTGLSHLAGALASEAPDLILLLGASGSGGPLAKTLAKTLEGAGEVIASRLAIRPGDPIGCGVLRLPGETCVPFVSMPGRIEAALAAWLLLARPSMHQLSGATGIGRGEILPLSRKIVSSLGMSDLVLLRRLNATNGSTMWQPLAAGDISWDAIAKADAWLAVAPDCEGYAAGQNIFAQFL